MLRATGRHRAAILDALADYRPPGYLASVRAVTMAELAPGMLAEHDITSRAGVVLVRAGTEMTHPLLDRLRRFALGVGVTLPIVVRVSARDGL